MSLSGRTGAPSAVREQRWRRSAAVAGSRCRRTCENLRIQTVRGSKLRRKQRFETKEARSRTSPRKTKARAYETRHEKHPRDFPHLRLPEKEVKISLDSTGPDKPPKKKIARVVPAIGVSKKNKRPQNVGRLERGKNVKTKTQVRPKNTKTDKKASVT